jgi:PAS domain-containing protein
MITTRSRIDLRTFPSEDVPFREFVRDQLAGLDASDPERLQCSIRQRYPLALVRVRSELASLGGDDTVWYAFRRALIDPPDDRWWAGATSWAIIDSERAFVEASDRFAAIVEVPLTTLIGRRIEDLANPADPTVPDDVATLWADLLAHGQVHGTLRFNRLDGSPREIEYHVERDGAPDRYHATIRARSIPLCD